jgi:Tfp pilus assembly protein PilF
MSIGYTGFDQRSAPLARLRAAYVTIALLLLAACGPSETPADAGTDPMQRGLALLQTGDGIGAAEQFRTILATNPSHYGAQFQLGAALDVAGEVEAARPEWQKALALAEQYQDSATITSIRERLARPDVPTDEQQMARGLRKLYTMNDPLGAAEEFKAVIARTPTHYGAHFQLASAYDRAGLPDQARPLWEAFLKMAEAIKDEPNAAIARERLAATTR